MSQAIEILMREHRFIERMLGSLSAFSGDLRGRSAPGPEDRRQVAGYARFFREFADRCHHGKEEASLFTALARHGFVPEEGPLAVMLHEHELGRRHVRRLTAIGDGEGPLTEAERREIAEVAAELGSLLSHHIQKEDGVLFPMAMRALPPDVQQQVHEEFETFEREEMGEGVHEELHGLAEALLAAHPPRQDVASHEPRFFARGASGSE